MSAQNVEVHASVRIMKMEELVLSVKWQYKNLSSYSQRFLYLFNKEVCLARLKCQTLIRIVLKIVMRFYRKV